MLLLAALLLSQATPVKVEDLDSLVEWVDGAARRSTAQKGPQQVVWTTTTAPEWNGLRFGDSRTPGLRHLRIGFKKDLETGSVLAQGGGRASALKAGAAGDPGDESQWTPGRRLDGGAAVGKEYALWTFPPGTRTRALRFSHDSASSDKEYSGLLGGVWILSARYADLARAAAVSASANDHHAAKVVNGRHDDWSPWDNTTETMVPVAERPEWLLLAWPAEVTLSGLCALGAGFADGEVQTFTGPGHPREAAESEWTSIRTFSGFKSQYPRTMSPNWIDFGREVKTRAVRLRMSKVVPEEHPHMKGNTKDGKRVWLHELLALSPLGAADLESARLRGPEALHPPLPVRFTLDAPARVTLVIEDAEGRRVRNLISETPYPAGENTAWWDGLDDLGRDRGAAAHAIYHVPGKSVAPGAYRVRGLRRGEIDLRYEMSVYNSGHPAWPTADRSGGWLADHSPPSDILFVPADAGPQVWIASHVAEGGDGLVMINLDGKKVGAIRWLGGNWTGASHLARDGNAVYTAAGWEQDKDKKKGDIRLMKIDAKGQAKRVAPFPLDERKDAEVGGLAARNGLLAVSLPKRNEVVLVDVAAEKILSVNKVEDPKGLAFEPGALLAVSGKKLLRWVVDKGALAAPREVATFEDPCGIALDAEGRLYVSDRGMSHQVKVFTPDGKPLRTIGTPGAPKLGAYDPHRMTEPSGLTVAADGTVWVAEHSFQPKRISAWGVDGKLLKAFYGPPEYGGGGQIDPRDPSRFYYNGMEFKLDWQKGTNTLVSVFYRPGAEGWAHPKGHHADGPPQQAIYANGKQYLSNSFNSNPTNGSSMVFLWELQDGRAKPVAAVGQTSHWDRFKPSKELQTFAWNDRNGNGTAEDEEIDIQKGRAGGLVMHDDLSIVSSQGWRLAWPYELAKRETVVDGIQGGLSSGGDQAMTAKDGWTILTTAPKPFGADSMAGVKDGKPLWSYPSLWPGLHASHNAPLPTFPGQLLGTTRLLGGFVSTPAGELWAVNGNMGNVYLFTTDGLFVATLWKDGRLASWAMPAAIRGMSVKDASLHTEDFWPTLTQTSAGETYITVGVNTTSTIVRVTGLETLKRLPTSAVTVTNADLAACADYFVKRDLARASREGSGTLEVAIRKTAPEVDGKLEDWSTASWVTIDSRTKQVGDWGHEEMKSRAALAVAGERLYAAFRTGEPELLRNTAEALPMLFKTGGALDLLIGTDPSADPKREKPVVGDLRLIVTRTKDRTVAALYRAVVPGTTNPLPFSSPWRTVSIDRVDDVSAEVKLAADKGLYEFSIPLAVLGLQPGQPIRGDVGLLRGNGFQTLQRVYWQNKATGLTADVPGEAMLTPHLWGRWIFKPE